jgi:hypothetical protein
MSLPAPAMVNTPFVKVALPGAAGPPMSPLNQAAGSDDGGGVGGGAVAAAACSG